MSGFLPIFLDLKDKPVLLLGGGRVALEKLEKLALAGAAVRLIARHIQPETHQVIERHGFSYAERDFLSSDIAGHILVISALNDAAGHAQVAALARAQGILVNTVDAPSSADFYFCSHIERGPLHIGISTQGMFPGVARALRLWLEELLPEQLNTEFEQLAMLRQRLKDFIPDPSQRMQGLKEQLQIWQKQWQTVEVHSLNRGDFHS